MCKCTRLQGQTTSLLAHCHKEERKQHWGSPPVCNAVGEKVGCTCCHHAAPCKASALDTAAPISAANLWLWLLKCTGPEHSALCVLGWGTPYFHFSSWYLLGCSHHRRQGGVWNILLWAIFSVAIIFFCFFFFYDLFLSPSWETVYLQITVLV